MTKKSETLFRKLLSLIITLFVISRKSFVALVIQMIMLIIKLFEFCLLIGIIQRHHYRIQLCLCIIYLLEFHRLVDQLIVQQKLELHMFSHNLHMSLDSVSIQFFIHFQFHVIFFLCGKNWIKRFGDLEWWLIWFDLVKGFWWNKTFCEVIKKLYDLCYMELNPI